MGINAVYAGTFDPVTNGHLDIIERASKMYDTLYVTIFDNPNKKTLQGERETVQLTAMPFLSFMPCIENF